MTNPVAKTQARPQLPLQPKHPHRQHRHHPIALLIRHKRLVAAIVLIALLGVLLPQITALNQSLGILKQASWLLILVALGLTALNYLISAELYNLLVKKPVALTSLQLVQVATALTSRLAPVGVGTIGLYVLFLQRRKHTLPEALAVAAANNVIILVAHFTILAVIIATAPLPDHFSIGLSRTTIIAICFVLAALCAGLSLFSKIRRAISRAVQQTLAALASYRNRPRTLFIALAVAMIQSCIYVLALMACCQALFVMLPFNQLFVIYTFSLLIGTASAIPGGLGGVEAGLAGGLLAYGVNTDTAIAVALLYRLVTYWLPLIPGLFALRVVQRRYF